MLDYYDLRRLKSYASADCNQEIVEGINELIVKQSVISDLEVYIQEKYKQGYNYLDIAKEFRDKGNRTIINDDVFLVFVDKEIVIIFEHTSFTIKS